MKISEIFNACSSHYKCTTCVLKKYFSAIWIFYWYSQKWYSNLRDEFDPLRFSLQSIFITWFLSYKSSSFLWIDQQPLQYVSVGGGNICCLQTHVVIVARSILPQSINPTSNPLTVSIKFAHTSHISCPPNVRWQAQNVQLFRQSHSTLWERRKGYASAIHANC